MKAKADNVIKTLEQHDTVVVKLFRESGMRTMTITKSNDLIDYNVSADRLPPIKRMTKADIRAILILHSIFIESWHN